MSICPAATSRQEQNDASRAYRRARTRSGRGQSANLPSPERSTRPIRTRYAVSSTANLTMRAPCSATITICSAACPKAPRKPSSHPMPGTYTPAPPRHSSTVCLHAAVDKSAVPSSSAPLTACRYTAPHAAPPVHGVPRSARCPLTPKPNAPRSTPIPPASSSTMTPTGANMPSKYISLGFNVSSARRPASSRSTRGTPRPASLVH